jgi:subtilase family serine protease
MAIDRVVHGVAVAALVVIASGPALAAEPGPDIVIERWSTPRSVAAGSTFTVVVNLANTGRVTSGKFTSEVRLNPPEPAALRIDPVCWTTEALRPGQPSQGALRLSLPRAAPPGEYVLQVIVDVDHAVAEENEHNNLAERRLLVTIPTP